MNTVGKSMDGFSLNQPIKVDMPLNKETKSKLLYLCVWNDWVQARIKLLCAHTQNVCVCVHLHNCCACVCTYSCISTKLCGVHIQNYYARVHTYRTTALVCACAHKSVCMYKTTACVCVFTHTKLLCARVHVQNYCMCVRMQNNSIFKTCLWMKIAWCFVFCSIFLQRLDINRWVFMLF